MIDHGVQVAHGDSLIQQVNLILEMETKHALELQKQENELQRMGWERSDAITGMEAKFGAECQRLKIAYEKVIDKITLTFAANRHLSSS